MYTAQFNHSRHIFYTSVHTFFNSMYTVFNILSSWVDMLLQHYSTHLLNYNIHHITLQTTISSTSRYGSLLQRSTHSSTFVRTCPLYTTVLSSSVLWKRLYSLHPYTTRLPRRYHDPHWMGRQILNFKHVDPFGRAVLKSVIYPHYTDSILQPRLVMLSSQDTISLPQAQTTVNLYLFLFFPFNI